MARRCTGADEEVEALRVNGPEGGQRVGVERLGIPFAFDGIR